MRSRDGSSPTTPEQFKALGHPLRQRLLLALGHREATISQLATLLSSNKGNIAYHLKVLSDAGLISQVGTRTVRGGTEKYYRATSGLRHDDPALTQAVLTTLAAEITAASPEPFLVLRMLRLSPEHADQLTDTLRDLAGQPADSDAYPRYGLLLGLYQPAELPDEP